MARSRLMSVREKREIRQALLLIVVTITLLVGFLFWGLPAIASFVGNTFIKNNAQTNETLELAPTTPILSDIPEATNSAKLVFSGFAQPGVTVELYINSSLADSITVGDSGTFVTNELELIDGENIVYGFAKSVSGELESEKSREYVVTVDTTAPTLTITSPSDGAVFHRESERVVTIRGSVDQEGTKVVVGERLAIVSPELGFDVAYQLIEGDQEIIIRATDKAGNESEQRLKLRWEN